MNLYSAKVAAALLDIDEQTVKKHCRNNPEIGTKLDNNDKAPWILTDENLQQIKQLKEQKGSKKKKKSYPKQENVKIFNALERMDKAGGENSQFMQKIKHAATTVVQEILISIEEDFQFSTGHKIVDGQLLAADESPIPPENITRKTALRFAEDIAGGILKKWKIDLEKAERDITSPLFIYKKIA